MTARKTPTVPAIERGVRILEMVSKSANGLTFSQIAQRMDFPKSSVHSILITFERLGYLQKLESSGRYVVGLNLARIGSAPSHGMTLRQKAGPVLCNLTQKTGLSSHLAILEGKDALLIGKVQPYGSSPVATWIGKRIDYYCTSLGKALIAWLPEEEIDQLVKERQMLRYNENTICTLARLKEDLARTRQLGYSLDDEEEEIGVRCVGAPVMSATGEVSAAVSVSGQVGDVRREDIARLGSVLQEAAVEIARLLTRVAV